MVGKNSQLNNSYDQMISVMNLWSFLLCSEVKLLSQMLAEKAKVFTCII